MFSNGKLYMWRFSFMLVTAQELEVLSLSHLYSEYVQEIPQSQNADNPVAPRGRAAQLSRDTRKSK